MFNIHLNNHCYALASLHTGRPCLWWEQRPDPILESIHCSQPLPLLNCMWAASTMYLGGAHKNFMSSVVFTVVSVSVVFTVVSVSGVYRSQCVSGVYRSQCVSGVYRSQCVSGVCLLLCGTPPGPLPGSSSSSPSVLSPSSSCSPSFTRCLKLPCCWWCCTSGALPLP